MMSLTIILICLLAERFLLHYQELRQIDWLSNYSDWFARQELPNWLQQGFAGIAVLLLPPLLVVSLLQHLLNDSLFGIPGALYACLVLLYSLGPEDLDQQITAFNEAREKNDQETADSIARSLLKDTPPPTEPAYTQAVAEAILEQANNRVFAVIFWFLVLGPFGALLYRLVSTLPNLKASHTDLDFFIAARQLLAVLDWIPARITAFTYAIAGSFEDALYGWRSYHESRFDEFSNNASGILICTGAGALRMSSLLDDKYDLTDSYQYIIEAVMGLVWRSLLVWLALLGLFTLAGWI
ncbi:MAG: regulatory signaling modulator protein AmpE [Chromatiales bacterium]|jgi:membrane protein required for beta-lactamase induction